MKKDLHIYQGVQISERWVSTSEKGLSVAVAPQRVREIGTVEQVLSYTNNSVVARIMEELKVSEDVAAQLFTDLKRFLWLSAVSSEEHLVPSPILDEAWHAFVLFTADYADFCKSHFDGFLHHAPQRHGEKRLSRGDLQGTIDAMNREFGGVPSPFWHYIPVQQALQA
jgi:hypothetical protein